MKKFMDPEIELVKFQAMDVIATSQVQEEEEPTPEEYCVV